MHISIINIINLAEATTAGKTWPLLTAAALFTEQLTAENKPITD